MKSNQNFEEMFHNYMEEDERLATFKQKWVFPKDAPCSAKKLAEAGFIFIGSKQEPDAVKCFFCDKSLDGWESEDCPWEEHLSHSNNCEFAKLQQPEGSLTVYQFLDLKEKYGAVLIDKYFEEQKKDIQTIADSILAEIDKKLKKLKR